MADDIMNMDLYELLGTVASASVKEIKTSYRKKALSCHPDKNPDNPRAAELFHELKRALEILIDKSAKAAYDKVLNGRAQAKARLVKLDSKRRKFQEDLEAREEAYRRSQNISTKSDEQKLKEEIERLKKEGSRQVEEEVELLKKQIAEQLAGDQAKNDESAGTRVKIKWESAKDDPDNGGYSYDNLYQILSKHGDISVLVISSCKKGRALVEYKDKSAAVTAVQIEMGLFKNPISLQGLWESDEKSYLLPTNKKNALPNFSSINEIFVAQRQMSDRVFENSVLKNMKRAEERRKLIEQLKAEEDAEEQRSKS